MSDGPHRSLPMRRPWKELAMRGDQEIYDEVQVVAAAMGALASDVKNEVKWSLIDLLKSIFTGRDNSIKSPEIAIQELEEAKSSAGGSVFGMNAIAWSIELINEGKFGLDAFHQAIGLAAKMRGFANVRSVEEHYLRKSSEQRATNVSRRLNSAISSLSEATLGSAIVAPVPAKARRQRKMSELDEGVPL